MTATFIPAERLRGEEEGPLCLLFLEELSRSSCPALKSLAEEMRRKKKEVAIVIHTLKVPPLPGTVALSTLSEPEGRKSKRAADPRTPVSQLPKFWRPPVAYEQAAPPFSGKELTEEPERLRWMEDIHNMRDHGPCVYPRQERLYLVMLRVNSDQALLRLGREISFPRGCPLLWCPATGVIQSYGFYPKFSDASSGHTNAVDARAHRLVCLRKYSGFLSILLCWRRSDFVSGNNPKLKQ
ncbi:unnamed protein product, partial [Amoebophrya sp. A25]|eukprot:GSA25T00024128001.1